MNSFERILLSLSAYSDTISGIGNRYKAESRNNDKFKGSAVYSEMAANTKNLFKSEFDKARNAEQKEINDIFTSINDTLARWINSPVKDSRLLDTVIAAKESGVTFSLSELRYLSQNISGYWGSRIIAEIARSEGLNAIEFQEFNNLETIERSIKTAKTSTDNFLQWYSGDNLQAYDLLDPEQLNNSFSTAFASAASDSEVFKSNSPLLTAALIFSEDDLPVTFYRKSLSDSDKAIIKHMIPDDLSKEDKQARVNDLISENSDLQEIFNLDSSLQEFLPDKK